MAFPFYIWHNPGKKELQSFDSYKLFYHCYHYSSDSTIWLFILHMAFNAIDSFHFIYSYNHYFTVMHNQHPRYHW